MSAPVKCPECDSAAAATTVYHEPCLRQYDRLVEFGCGSKMYRLVVVGEWDNGECRYAKTEPYWGKLEDQTKECLYRALQHARRGVPA